MLLVTSFTQKITLTILKNFVAKYSGIFEKEISKISSLKFCAEKFTLKLKTSKSERQATKGGRTSDFINLMLKTHIDEKDKKSATKGMTQDEMIGQVAI